MCTVYVLGLFKSQKSRFEAQCRRLGLGYKYILAGTGREGTLDLLPVPGDAIHSLRSYLDSLPEYQAAHIIVFPYVPLPKELQAELNAIQDLGGAVFRPCQGEDGWPTLPMGRRKPDQTLLDATFDGLLCLLPGFQKTEQSVSEYFRETAAANEQLLFADGVYDTCDSVARMRYDFMRQCVDALSDLASSGAHGRVDNFFQERGIGHAQTGGIQTSLTVRFQGVEIHKSTSHAHLKKGDGTTAWAAVRVYYQMFTHGGLTYVVVMYAGPHPDRSVSWVCDIPDV